MPPPPPTHFPALKDQRTPFTIEEYRLRVQKQMTQLSSVSTNSTSIDAYDSTVPSPDSQLISFNESMTGLLTLFSKTISTDPADPRPISFTKLVESKPAFEVCRMFLASLHLINEGHLMIEAGESGDILLQWSLE